MAKSPATEIHSMTGFASVEGEVGGTMLRVEMKALNHRFLDLKVRLPRELSAAEMPLRALLQQRFSRGAIDLKVDRVADATVASSGIQTNLSLAASYFEALITLQKTLGLTDPVRTTDIASLPDVITRSSNELQGEEAWTRLQPLVEKAITKLAEMRAHEGQTLARVLTEAAAEMERALGVVRVRRDECAAAYKAKITEKVRGVFEAYPLPEGSVQAVLESRIAQELAMLLDRTDVQEELTRFQGHLDHLRKVLREGGKVGRKLDFILQEMNREINTLGNKAQDFSISEEVIQVKVRLEQLREQVMNLE